MPCEHTQDDPKSIGRLDPDTSVSHHSYAAALKAAGAVCSAVDRLVSNQVKMGQENGWKKECHPVGIALDCSESCGCDLLSCDLPGVESGEDGSGECLDSGFGLIGEGAAS